MLWVPQMFGYEALALLGIVGREVDRIELGTAVVPTYPRHPVTMAQEALTASAASGGRVVAGIGLSRKMVIEGIFGCPSTGPWHTCASTCQSSGPAEGPEGVVLR